jgi:hypothetical protein
MSFGKNYSMKINAGILATVDKAGLDALIAENPEAYDEGTQIKIVAGPDAAGDEVAGDDANIYIVLSTKVVGFIATPII